MKNLQVQGLRGISIIIIMVFHFFYRYDNLYLFKGYFEFMKYWGDFGVCVFFLISGFYLIPPKENDVFNLKIYLLKKLKKLYPLYLISIIIIYISVKVGGLEGRETGIVDMVLNIFLINIFMGKTYIDGAHWFLTYTIIFIIIAGLIRKFKLSNNIKTFLVWDIVALGIYFLSQNTDSIIINDISIALGGFYMIYIIMGIMINKWVNHLITASEFYLIFILLLFEILLMKKIEMLIICVISVLLFFSVINNKNKYLKNRFWVFCGNISYPLYLIHQNIGYQCINFLSVKTGYKVYYSIIAIFISLAIAYLLFYVQNIVILKRRG